MKVLVIPALAFLALLAWWLPKDGRLVEPPALPVTLPLGRATSDGLVVGWRRAGVI